MRENRDFFCSCQYTHSVARAPFSWAAQHTTVYLDIRVLCKIAFKLGLHQICQQIFWKIGGSEQRAKSGKLVKFW